MSKGHFLKALGPGLVFAGTCVGVSHVVQSTRAGADFGFALVWAVLAANIFKFPFFEFAPRYACATGDNLLVGYRKVGKWAFYLFFILSLCTMFPIQAAVTLVCTGLFVNLLHWPFPPVYLSGIILIVCCLILLLGKYPILDKLMKVMIIILSISTIFAFITAVAAGSQAQAEYVKPFVWDVTGMSFLIALMGWMPSTFEISVWHSFWSAERRKQTNYRPTLSEVKTDFHIGYWGTTVLALLFLGLGALMMYGTGESMSSSAVTFTNQVVTLYTKALGPWSYWIIVTAAATTMFSTTISCLDAFPRVIREAVTIINPNLSEKKEQIYLVAIIIISIVATLIIGKFIHRLKTLIDFATILAFLAAPIFAYINLRTVTSSHVPVEFRPSKGYVFFSWICLFFLAGFGMLFIVWRFFLS